MLRAWMNGVALSCVIPKPLVSIKCRFLCGLSSSGTHTILSPGSALVKTIRVFTGFWSHQIGKTYLGIVTTCEVLLLYIYHEEKVNDCHYNKLQICYNVFMHLLQLCFVIYVFYTFQLWDLPEKSYWRPSL